MTIINQRTIPPSVAELKTAFMRGKGRRPDNSFEGSRVAGDETFLFAGKDLQGGVAVKGRGEAFGYWCVRLHGLGVGGSR